MLLFVAGPKAYCLRMRNKQNGAEEFSWRLKGVPLNVDNKNQLPFERFKEMAGNYGQDLDPEATTELFNIKKNFKIDRRGGIETVHMDKRVRPLINKGVVVGNQKIVPFGWSDKEWCRTHNPRQCDCMDFNQLLNL